MSEIATDINSQLSYIPTLDSNYISINVNKLDVLLSDNKTENMSECEICSRGNILNRECNVDGKIESRCICSRCITSYVTDSLAEKEINVGGITLEANLYEALSDEQYHLTLMKKYFKKIQQNIINDIVLDGDKIEYEKIK